MSAVVEFVWLLILRVLARLTEPRGRCTSWMPFRCGACGWVGPLRFAVHLYAWRWVNGNRKSVNMCPKCNSTELQAVKKTTAEDAENTE